MVHDDWVGEEGYQDSVGIRQPGESLVVAAVDILTTVAHILDLGKGKKCTSSIRADADKEVTKTTACIFDSMRAP